MNKNIDCRIIQDLLPSYVDGLTSDHTNQVIKEHVQQCESCKQMLERMQEPEKHIDSAEKEVDYMKKVRNRMGRLLTTALISIAFLIIGAVASILIYNRVTPENYQDVFGGNNVNWFVVKHPASGSEFTLEDWEVQDFQGMLELANYYYEGKENDVIEGDLLVVSVGNSYGPLYELKITEDYKMYYDGKVYDIRDSKHLWDDLNNMLQTKPVWKEYEKEQYDYLNGRYVMEFNGPEEYAISFELDLDSKLFSLITYAYSSYWETGTFSIDDLTVTLKVNETLNVYGGRDYVFDITEEGILSYDAENSAPLCVMGEDTPIPDGTKFIKE